MTAIYNTLASLVIRTITVPWHLLLIGIGRFSREELNQRLGRTKAPEKKRSRILIHAVSVGEMAAVEPVIQALLNDKKDEGYEFMITTGNKDGMRSAVCLQKHHPEIVSVQFLPWDVRAIVLPWLRRLQPDLVAIVETELWPNLFTSCGELHIPLCLINARIYPHDVQRYRMVFSFFRKVLQHVSWIGVQDAREREHFIAIGAAPEKVAVIGNTKFDVPAASQSLPDKWQRQFEGLPLLIVAGSTHFPEERWIVESFRQLRKTYPSIRLVLAPRHVTRADSIVRMAEKNGLRTVCWSIEDETASREWDILVLDETGWLSAVYRYATVAIVGGSFVNHGGHNILEPAAQGCAILTGPHVQHFQSIVEDFNAGGAIVWIAHHEELATALMRMLSDRSYLGQLQQNAHRLVQSRRGIADQYATEIRNRFLHSPETITSGVHE